MLCVLEDSSLRVRYIYDSWGNTISIQNRTGQEITSQNDIGNLNPFRYRGYYFDSDTGLYYLQNRYYDPKACRFVNGEAITDGGAGILGNNIFIYAANNSINNSDSTGQWIIKDAIKWVAKNIVKPVVKTIQKALSKVNLTYSTGVNISGSPSAFSFNLQGGISIDTKGNVALQGSFSGGVTAGSPSISITSYRTITNAPNIKKLTGPGYQIGGSVGVPVSSVSLVAGGDFNIIPDTELNKTYYGITTNVGLGTPGYEFHVEWGETATWGQTQFNVFDVAEGIYVKIMEW